MDHQSRLLFSLLAGAAAFGAALPSTLAAEQRTVLHHGKIFTADPARPWAEALIVHGDRIEAVGSNVDVLARAQGARLYDLGGRTVVPGLDDAHVHVLALPVPLVADPSFIPGPGPTLPELLAQVQAAAETTPPGTWLGALVGVNVTEDPETTRFALDTVAGDHPVIVRAWWGHGTWLSTNAMTALGIGEQEPDPFGGFYTRVPGTSILTGAAHEYAEYGIWRRIYDGAADADLAAQYQAHAAAAVAAGVTSIQDMAVGLTQQRATSIVAAARLPIRVREICFPLTPDEACGEGPGGGADPAALLRQSGIKWVTDGTPIERLASVESAYADRPGFFGNADVPADPLHDILLAGRRGSPRDNQMIFHSVGDAAIDRVLDGLEATGGAPVWKHRRTRIEHGELLFPGNFARMRDLGAMVVQNPLHFTLGPIFEQRFAPSIFAEMEPLRTLLDQGIPLALGSDSVGQPPRPWLDVFLATVHPTRPDEALTVEQAVTAYTRGAAYAELAEDRKGSLAPGKLADLAVLSQDPFSVPLPAIPGTTSVLTLVGGEIVWDTGAVVRTGP